MTHPQVSPLPVAVFRKPMFNTTSGANIFCKFFSRLLPELRRPAKLRQVLAIVYRVIARHYAGAAGVAVSQGHPGPVADRRISLTPNGNIRYALKTPYRDGTTHVVPDPMGLVARLAALVARPRVNLTRYHGLFAAASRLRAQITPESSPIQLCI